MKNNGNKTILVARQGYSNYEAVGGMERTAAASYCGQKFGVTSADFQPCVEHYAAGKAGDYSPGGTASGSGGTLDKIGDFASSLLKGIVGGYVAGKQPQQQYVAAPSTTPPWLLPVAIGGAGLLVILMLKKRQAPTQNPARRRRRRRRRNRSRRR